MTADTPTLSLPLVRARDHAPTTAPSPCQPRPVTNTAPRFTVDGSAELESHLARTCAKIAAGLRGLLPPEKLEAVLLGGGYGRGEGGVLRTERGDRPYNDLEFYVCLRGNRHLNEKLHGHALHVLGEILTPQAGVEVEFKITSLRELAAKPVSMFSYDLVSGHRWLVGDETLLAGCAHHRRAENIPLAEATRLLMNRCSGLLFAEERLQRATFTAADADFVRRNIAKAELALGDALLVSRRHYHWSAEERQARIDSLTRAEDKAWLHDLCRHHAAGVRFKLHPERSVATAETLRPYHAELRRLSLESWLRLETLRLGRSFSSAAEYARHPIDKCPETAGPRNVLVNFKVLGPRAGLGAKALHSPRNRVLHALALLLWEPATVGTPALLARVQTELGTEATTFRDLVTAYREIWQHVN